MVALFVFGAVAVTTAHADTWAPSSATIIKKGSSSANVMWLQATLNATQGTTLAVDGKYGPKTTAAIVAFQKAHPASGKADGIAGKMTIAALNAAGASLGSGSTGGTPCPAGALFNPVTGVSCTSGPTTPQTGSVTAMLATNNPATGTIVAGQATADLMHVTFSGSGTVNSVTLQRGGVSDQNTLSNVYLYDGVQRLTDGYSFNTNGQITMNNLNLAVNGSRTISVKADVTGGSNSGYDIYTTLVGFTAGTSVNTVNLKGNDMFIASGSTLASASFTAANSVTAATVNAGTSSYAVFRAPLQVNTRTLWLKAANFRVTGSAPSDALQNVGFYVDGVKVGNNAMMTTTNGSNYLSFDMTAAPVQLTTGSHTVEVRADITKGSSYNFTVSLQQASDLMVYDPQVGVNLAIGGTIPSTAGMITIGAGSATFTVDPTFSSMTNVTGGASNATIAKFKIHGYGEDVKVTSLIVSPAMTFPATTYTSGTVTAGSQAITVASTAGFAVGNTISIAGATTAIGTVTAITSSTVMQVTITTAGVTPAGAVTVYPANGGLQNVTLYFNGSQVGSQQTWTGTGSLTYTLGSQLMIPAGVDSTLEVRADLRTTAGLNYTAGTVKADLGAGTGEGWSSHSTVTTPATTGTSLTIQTGLLAVAKNTGYANQSQNPNTSGVKIGSFVLQNQSSSESVRVTSFTVGLTTNGTTVLDGTTTPLLTNFSGLRTSETSGSGATPVQPQASNTFSVDFTLAPGATKVIDILADTSSGSGSVVTTLAVNALGVSSNTSISVAAVAGQTISLSAGTVAAPTLLTASATTAQYIAAGTNGLTDGSKASYNFVSTGGASTISELKFTVTSSAGNTVQSIRVGTVSAPVVGGIAWLQGLNLAVPNGGAGLTVDAYVTYAPVGTSGTIPGSTSIVGLTYVKYSSGGTTTVLTPTVNAPQMTLVGSKPTVSVNTTQATGLIIGAENKIGEVTVSADANGNIKLNDIAFSVGSSNFPATGSAGTLVLTGARIADGTTTVVGSGCVANGSGTTSTTTVFCEFGTVGNTFATGAANTESNTDFDGLTIAAGTSKTFSLYATVTGTVSTSGGVTSVSTSVPASSFNWDDASYAAFVADGTTASPANGTNLTGSLIYNFPTGSYSVKQ